METHTHYYFLNLMVSDLVQAIGECYCGMTIYWKILRKVGFKGGVISVKWAVDAVSGFMPCTKLNVHYTP